MKNLLLLLFFPFQLSAQTNGFANFKKYPFPTELCASSKTNKIAWAFDEQGKRNVYVAEGPNYVPRKLTNFTKDDGQEITSIKITDDGSTVVFVRGGEHGGNWETGLPINPAHDAQSFKVQIARIAFVGGETKYISEGDYPSVSTDGKKVAFLKSGQVWLSSIDSFGVAKNLFTTRGTVRSLEWNNEGTELLFVSSRGDHALIGIFNLEDKKTKWIAPSFNHDSSPRWSIDNKKIVFVRRPGTGGAPDSMLVNKHQPWQIFVADVATNKASMIYTAPKTLRGSIPTTHGGVNLHWAADDKIVFLSYQDGQPHLYAVASDGGTPLLLTPGEFMCEHINLSSDKKFLTFSANTGNNALDIERRHACIVSVDKADMRVLTNGNGLEWTPILNNDSKTVAFIAATPTQSPLVAVKNVNANASAENSSAIKFLGNNLIPTDFKQQKLITPQQVIFKSADGFTIHGQLFLPEGGAAKKPAIVYVHGGPPRQMLLGWHYSDYYSNAYASNQYLASLGFVVLSVNYRLGIGYGYEFHNPEKGGASGGAEYADVKAAGEWLQKQNFVNPEKIGIYGGSYGGYLTAMALARDSKLFAAGVDIHGVHDWGMAQSIMSEFDGKTEKAPDYDKAIQIARSSSPIADIKTWTSPVLIIHADDDRNVRFNQSTDLINRLEKQGVNYETLMIVDDTHHWFLWENAVTVYGAVADYFVKKFMKS